MMKTVPFAKRPDADLHALDPGTEREILYHRDVVPESVMLAVEKRQLYGAGYLLRTPGQYYSLVFHTDIRTEAGITAAEVLLAALTKAFRKLRRSDRTRKCRLWCREEETAYRAFLESFGFAPADTMYRMVCPLADTPAGDQELPDGMEIRAIDLNDPAVMREYLRVNGEAFGIPDSGNEMLFRINHADGEVFAVMKGNELIAAVTVWPVTEVRAATENVFCAESYRRQGITSALLCEVHRNLYAGGYREAELRVYEADTGARLLYEKLGYVTECVETEMQME